MMRDPFFQEAKIWSRRKHRILGKYLKPFSAKVGRFGRTIFIIDGFAGRAKYDDGTEGSPLLTATLSDECGTWRNPVGLRIINVEKNFDHYSSLIEATADWASRGIVTNMRGTFAENLSKILSKIGSHPGFFFIDPYGPSEIPFADLEPILNRTAITELIINFDLDGLCRIADTIRMESNSERALKTRESDVALVNRITGTSEWQESFRIEDAQRDQQLLRRYMEDVSKHGFNVVAYPVRESIRSKPKYYLIYCTRHQDGVKLMNDFLREEEDELIKEIGREASVLLLSEDIRLEPEIRHRRKELRSILVTFWTANRVSTRGTAKDRFMSSRFGDFHTKDYNAVVSDLIDDGKFITGHGKKRINDETKLTLAPNAG